MAACILTEVLVVSVMGVFLRFEDDSVESAKAAMQWNVKIISLSKHKRHKDKTAVLEFWDGLDASIRSRKLNLVY
jgi:parafibromin